MMHRVLAHARASRVVHDPAAAAWLVVWRADDVDTATLLDNEFELFGQWVEPGTGRERGINDDRFSDVGGTGESTSDVHEPAPSSEA